jgi:serine/threonine-protein kinase
MKEAKDAINNGHFDRAIALLSGVIDGDPKNTDASTLRGIAYHKLQKYDLAIADLSAAIEGNPKDANAHFFRARSFYKTRNYTRAIDDYKIVDALPADGSNNPLNNLAWLFATCPDDQVRDGGKATDYIDRALERRPNDLELWDTCAAVLAENGDFDGAIEWEKACIDSREIPKEQRRDCEKRLTVYEQHCPYRDEPESASTQLAASLAEPGK